MSFCASSVRTLCGIYAQIAIGLNGRPRRRANAIRLPNEPKSVTALLARVERAMQQPECQVGVVPSR